MWPHFKTVHVTCSVDGIGKYADYIRPPGNWSRIEENISILDKMNINLSLDLSPTVSIFNFSHIPDMILWVLKKRFSKFSKVICNHILFRPEYFSIQNFPKCSKELIQDKFIRLWSLLEDDGRADMAASLKNTYSPLVNHMFAVDGVSHLERAWKKIEELDRHFDQNLQRDLPPIYELLRGQAHRLDFETL